MQKKRLKLYGWGAVISVGLALAGTLCAPFYMRVVSSVIYPFIYAQHAVVAPLQRWSERRRSSRELARQVQEVTDQRDALLQEVVQLRGMAHYYQSIKEVARFAHRYADTHAVLAHVVMRQFTSKEHYFLVDKGDRHGITTDMVAVYKNNLVGRVVQVFPFYSKVQLITDTHCSVAAYCAKTRATGVHEGVGLQDATVVRYVSHLAKVKEGDWVLSSGDGLVFPEGFVLGSISYAHKDGLYHDVSIKPFINVRKLSHCYLMQKGAADQREHASTDGATQ